MSITRLSDQDLAQFNGNFIAVGQQHAATLGWANSDVTAMTAQQNAFTGSITNATAARALAKSATETKAQQREKTLVLLRSYADVILAKKNIPDDLKIQLGLNPRNDQPSHVIPVPPADVTARGSANGVNVVRWKAGGNKPGVQYIVERRSMTSMEWQFVGVTTKRRFSHANQLPGHPWIYRVLATRNDIVSAPSDASIVYETNPVEDLAA
jgi:hypothetical protein